VLVFEDLHWADAAFLAFLEHLADWAQGVPLLVLCTAGPELYECAPSWAAGLPNASTINLPPLTDEETAVLISPLLERSGLPPDTNEALLGRAGTEEFHPLPRAGRRTGDRAGRRARRGESRARTRARACRGHPARAALFAAWSQRSRSG
jgi:hypothetical protein